MNICAFDKGSECNVLHEKNCKMCAFCKTREELAEGRQKATNRIATLPEAQRNHIKAKYYKQKRGFANG